VNEELIALRDEMRQGFADMRAEMRQGFEQVDQRFAQVDQRFAQVDQRFGQVDQRFAQVEQGLAGLHQGMAELARRLDVLDRRVEALEQRVRANGILLEALRDDVRQLAEAHVMLDQRVERYRREHEVAHQEVLALLRASYQDLDRRVTRLEGRIERSGPAV
jgi:chromosome segregation ATPase